MAVRVTLCIPTSANVASVASIKIYPPLVTRFCNETNVRLDATVIMGGGVQSGNLVIVKGKVKDWPSFTI